MTEASDAVANSITFEAVKDGCAQQQSGSWKLVLKLHPDQVSQALMLAAPGQRYVCVLVAVGDNEEAIPAEHVPTTNAPADKPKTRFDDMAPAQQAGILCGDAGFQKWITRGTNHPPDERGAADAIYERFDIGSRAYLNDQVQHWGAVLAHYRSDTNQTAEER